jgi:hypothetical protein
MSPAVYFAATYFSPFYFPSLAFERQETLSGYRDRDAFTALVTALYNTSEFSDIILGRAIDQSALGADRTPLAVIVPTQWSELDDADPTVNLRQVTFTLTIVVRDDDADQRFQLLDRLTSIAQNAIDGIDLDGGCLPCLTKVHSGHYEPQSRHPEQRVILTGAFSYLVSTNSRHDTTY